MRASGPSHHAQETNGPSSTSDSGMEKLVYRCHICSKKWVSRSLFLLQKNRWRSLTAMKRCFVCNAEVFPTNVEINGDKRENRLSNSVSKSNGQQSEISINTCATDNKFAIFGWDSINSMPVLFDSGAEVSVITVEHCGMVNSLSPSKINCLKGVTGKKYLL